MLNNINAAYAINVPPRNSSGLGPCKADPKSPEQCSQARKRDQVNFSQDGAATRKLAYPD